jgi:hypothetical protein
MRAASAPRARRETVTAVSAEAARLRTTRRAATTPTPGATRITARLIRTPQTLPNQGARRAEARRYTAIVATTGRWSESRTSGTVTELMAKSDVTKM